MKLHIPPNYLYLAVILSVVCYLLFPQFNTIPFPWSLAGFIVIAAGLYLVIRPWKVFMAHGTSEGYDDKTTCVVTADLYRHSRNPMYVGSVLALVGICIALQGNLLSFAGPLLLFGVLHFVFIPYEEKEMIAQFGDDYRSYMKKVRRWL